MSAQSVRRARHLAPTDRSACYDFECVDDAKQAGDFEPMCCGTLETRRLATAHQLVAVVAIFLALVSATQAGPAQTPDAKPQDSDEISLGTDLVTLDVSVVDRSNRPVLNVPESRFVVTEDGVAQHVDFFTKEQAPMSLALVIDTSGSMRTKLARVKDAAEQLVRAKRPDDEIAVATFSETTDLLEEFTSDTRDVSDALSGLDAKGTTALLDAIWLTADYVQREGRHRRKALVVVTDGLERGSFYTSEQVIRRLRQLDVRLYLIGFTDDLETSSALFHKSDRTKAQKLLATLADDTGGLAFLPSSLDDLGRVSDAIGTDLRTVYAIGYYSSNTKKDGTFRKVGVEVLADNGKPDERITARTRSGYFAAAR